MQVGGCHKPKCFPLFLFPSASGITLAQAMQGNCTTSFADTFTQRPGVKAQDLPKPNLLRLQRTPTCHTAQEECSSWTSDQPATADRRCLSFPCDTPAGESWDGGLKLFKHIILSWSCTTAQDSDTAHQPGDDVVKCLSLFLGHFWTHRQHQPYQRSLM